MNYDLTGARNIGLTSAVLGVAAGTAGLLAGTTVWTGNKNDPTTLGIVTILLAVIIAIASLTASGAATSGRALTASVGLGLPALIGLTTAGLVWIPAAAAGVAAAGFALQAAHRHGTIRETLRQSWPGILLATLAIIYLVLGFTAQNLAGMLGILGGLAVLAVLRLQRRSRWVASGLLAAGALPFAIVTVWSVVTPVAGILMMAIGIPSILTTPNPRRASPGTVELTGHPTR